MTSMMHRTGGYQYFDGRTFQNLELPYSGNEISMVVLLPKLRPMASRRSKSIRSLARAADDWIQKLRTVPTR